MSKTKVNVLNKLIGWFVGMLVLIACFVLFINVVLRALGYSLKWAEELTRYLIVWITFVGASMCVEDGSHVGIDVLPSRLGARGKLVLSIVINLIGVAFTAVMTYLGIKMVNQAIHFHQRTAAMMISMAIPYIGVPVGCGLMVVRYIQQIWYSINALLGKEI
ncbi:MAG: TRAP transporter small permease [Sphaerochaetaceae bacterium]